MNRVYEACEVVSYIKDSCWPGLMGMRYNEDECLVINLKSKVVGSNPYFIECVDAIKNKFSFVDSVEESLDGYAIIIKFGRG